MLQIGFNRITWINNYMFRQLFNCHDLLVWAMQIDIYVVFFLFSFCGQFMLICSKINHLKFQQIQIQGKTLFIDFNKHQNYKMKIQQECFSRFYLRNTSQMCANKQVFIIILQFHTQNITKKKTIVNSMYKVKADDYEVIP